MHRAKVMRWQRQRQSGVLATTTAGSSHELEEAGLICQEAQRVWPGLHGAPKLLVSRTVFVSSHLA